MFELAHSDASVVLLQFNTFVPKDSPVERKKNAITPKPSYQYTMYYNMCLGMENDLLISFMPIRLDCMGSNT